MRAKEDSRGFTLIELLIVVAIIAIIAAIAVPGLLRARVTSNETATIGNLRVINTAQHTYASNCGNGSYAAQLPTLRVGPANSPEGYLSPDLASAVSPVKSGYTYTLAAGTGGIAGLPDCNGSATITAYYVAAVPVTSGASGIRGFATNQAGSIWQDSSGLAPTEPFTAGGTVAPIK